MRLFLQIQGLVQGVGFRPFIYSLATKYLLDGYILNSSNGVKIEIEGKKEQIDSFLHSIKNDLPPLARIDKITQKELPCTHQKGFYIQKSSDEDLKTSAILPDMAICEDCLKEMNDPQNRRYKYPFINCTNCGPRYSIIKDIPYDRPYTSMSVFTMCKECEKEYTSPLDRRYHAQPISCNECGPHLYLYENGSVKSKDIGVIKDLAHIINRGGIVAVKGIGGFHLMCDAHNDKPIKRLREFKKRPFKPFAIMCKDETQASLYVKMNKDEKEALTAIEKPIVLMQKVKSPICDLIAPQTDRLGIFLPNTPLHVVLFEYLKNPILATSANLKSEPIITKKEDMDEKFGDILEGILDYDREIIHSCDDSILQIVDKKRVFLRVSRGIAPYTKVYGKKAKNILALGANTKNAIAFYMNEKLILSPYLGDMDNVKSYERMTQTIDAWRRFYQMEFSEIVCDEHPAYTTSNYAKTFNKKITKVYHHHAHILATLFDQNLPLEKEVLGISWDGTGYGEDGSIWGGEFLKVRGREFERVAYLKPFKLLGGDKSVKNINRILYSMLLDMGVELDEFKDISFLSQMHKKDINAPQCSSMGRLFDAVCYLATGTKEISYDGQSGLLLESLYDDSITEFCHMPLNETGEIEYHPMLMDLLSKRGDPVEVASIFINSLVELIVKIAKKYDLDVAVGGGVFQNKTLLKLCINRCKKEGIAFHFSTLIPANDGGICVGQIAYSLI